jgi:hypothetical protein
MLGNGRIDAWTRLCSVAYRKAPGSALRAELHHDRQPRHWWPSAVSSDLGHDGRLRRGEEGDVEGPWIRGQDFRCAEHGRSHCPDRSSDFAGREAGADLPPGQLRLPSGTKLSRRTGCNSEALQEGGLGFGP